MAHVPANTHTHRHTHLYLQIVATITCEKKKNQWKWKAFFRSVIVVAFALFLWLCGMWDLSSLTRNWTMTPAVEAQRPKHWTTREVSRSVILEQQHQLRLGTCSWARSTESEAACWEPTHETLPMTRSWGRNPDRQGGSGFQGFRKAAPGTHLKHDICLSDACLNRLLPNFRDTGTRPSLISSQIRINLEL